MPARPVTPRPPVAAASFRRRDDAPRRAPARPRPPPPRRRPAPRRGDAPTATGTRPQSRSRRYGCSAGLELAGDGVRRADGEVVEAPRLPEVEGGPGGVAEVLVGQLLAVVGGGAALALAAAVVVARELVDAARSGRRGGRARTRRAAPAAGRPAARRPARAPAPSTRAGPTAGAWLITRHDRTGFGSSITSQRSRRRAGEDRQPAGLVAVEAALHERLDAPEVVVDRPVAVGAAAGAPQHAIELVLDVLVAGQSPAVDVQVTGGDRSDVASDPCELPDGGFGDDGHSTSRSRRVW